MCEHCPTAPTPLPCGVCGFRHATAPPADKAAADRTVHVVVHLPARPSLADAVRKLDLA